MVTGIGTSWRVQTSNRKVLGSAPDRSTNILGKNKVNELTESRVFEANVFYNRYVIF